ncbi:MAG: hypothetical protein HZA50_17660 [Planctomycetes bacterium]|nr:hypothetical protein [Planctomycetota bacterium]
MKIVIQHNEGEWPIDIENPFERSLDELLDTFTQPEVREIINESLRVFRGMCNVWNQRELAERRKVGLNEGG